MVHGYIYIYIYVCVCVCVCIAVEQSAIGEKRKRIYARERNERKPPIRLHVKYFVTQ